MNFLASVSVKPYKNQRYEDLKKQAQESEELFLDPEFPADETSLFYQGNIGQLPGNVVWKRPKDIHENPHLFVDGACSCDVVQGMLGNCWFVAACSALAQEKELWNKVIPDYKEQEWDAENVENYAGIFHFRFWQLGSWIDVVIDDHLPTINGELVYIKSRDKNEFWGALLEKAYAKIAGSYEALDGGNLTDALVDFTGGISETIDLQMERYLEDEDKKVELFRNMRAEMDSHSLMCCAISALSQEEMEAQTEVGLVKGHAYGITAVKKVYIGDTGLISLFTEGRQKIYMVRMRNPWGAKEWCGPFSDGSEEWGKISESERERIGLTFDEDGEFWMLFDDFCQNFTDLSICRIVNTSWFSFGKTWSESSFLGKWTVGEKGTEMDRAGGCLNHKDTFLQNPQYRFDVENNDDTVMIYLTQKDKRPLKKEGVKNLVIGFHVMKVEANRRYRLHSMMEKAATSEYIMTRNVFHRLNLKAGRYVVIPTTFEPEQESGFLLRIFTSKDSNGKELVLDVPDQSIWPCITYPCLLTLVVVKGASGLEKQDRFAADPYCIVKCENERVRGPICHDTLDPQWDLKVLFYRKSPDSPIKIQVWNSNVVMDTCLGKAVVQAPLNSEVTACEVELYGRLREKGVKKPGIITVEVMTCDDLMRF